MDYSGVKNRSGSTKRASYTKLFLKIVEKKLITLGENQASKETTGVIFFNENYEGEVSRTGATTVNIPIDGKDPTVRAYVIATGINPENIGTDNLPIVVSGDWAINELLDGYEVHTVPAKVVARRMIRAAVSFAKTIDKDAITTLEATDNILKVGANLTKANVYTTLLDAQQQGQEDNIDFRGLIIPPKIFKLIKLDPNYTKNSDMGMMQAKTGRIGQIDGLPIVVGNGLDAKTQMILVDPDHATRIVAWKINPKLVSLDGSKTYIGASAIKGRLIFKHVITNNKGILVVTNEAKN